VSGRGHGHPPVLVIGLDGATYEILEPLFDGGDMPTLAGLRARGAWGVLRSVVPPITPAAWSSFMTGKYPSKHGIYDFRIYDPRTRRDTFVTSRALREPTLWELLTEAGGRVGCVNLPVTYPPSARAGTIVSGFDTPSLRAGFTHPPELRERILARIPDYFFVAVPDPRDPNLEQDECFERFVTQVERAFAQRTEVAVDLLHGERWDAFMLHYQDTDVLQHRVWRFFTERDRYPGRWARLRRVYRHLDDCVARLLAAAGPDPLVLVVSDHGFGTQEGRVYPNVLLRRWGVLSWAGYRREKAARWLRKRLGRLGIHVGRPSTESWIAQTRDRSLERTLRLGWRRTQAYVALAELYGLLYVNVRGREPQGIVAPGDEQRAVARRVGEKLRAVRDPRDGQPVFTEILEGEDVFPHDPYGNRPDLVLIPRPEYSVSRELNPRRWIDHYPVTSGTHRPEGVLIASGPGIRPGRLARDAHLVDVAPTILAATSVPVPDDMDGRVLVELFADAPHVDRVAGSGPVLHDDPALTPEEEDAVVHRLRSLGYME
jgi:predicted AlkP superfamily phosphohydrolase/phosphomutase